MLSYQAFAEDLSKDLNNQTTVVDSERSKVEVGMSWRDGSRAVPRTSHAIFFVSR
jgi:hypothetical protein